MTNRHDDVTHILIKINNVHHYIIYYEVYTTKLLQFIEWVKFERLFVDKVENLNKG